MSAGAWGPGRYDPGNASQGGAASGNGGPASGCQCNKVCCVPDAENHYGLSFDDGTLNNNQPYLLETQQSGSLTNRVAVEFLNDGAQDLQINSVQQFAYGDGRTITSGASFSQAISSQVKHYVRCKIGQTCHVHVTELGLFGG